MIWSPLQSAAIKHVAQWLRVSPRDSQLYYLAGYAGTGKTTIAQHLVANARRRWLFASFTGKAASVMRRKGCLNAQTIHSLIYRPNGESREAELKLVQGRIQTLERKIADADEKLRASPADVELLIRETADDKSQLAKLRQTHRELRDDNQSRFALWAGSPLADPDVEGVVIDECSMVDARVAGDLESFGKKILVLGDPAQLPPVGAGGYYTERKPDTLLTEVHRHARDSGILALATWIREGRSVRDFAIVPDDLEIIKISSTTPDERDAMMHQHDQTLVGRNATRQSANRRWRALSQYRESPTPMPGELLICLRNERSVGLLNGAQWIVEECEADLGSMSARVKLRGDDDQVVETDAWLHHFVGRSSELDDLGPARRDLSEFDFGYCLTVHKSQGSQWDRVLLVDESRSFGEHARRWLYTGVTRAARKLTVLA